jgi:tetratricopeptide (TPR) repeat protein
MLTPFWGRIPRFFLFPLHPPILFRIGLFAALPVLCVVTTSIKAGVVVYGGLSLLAWVFYLRLGSGIFSETSRGRLSPEQYDREKDESLAYMPYALFALFFVASLAVGLVDSLFGNGAAIAANVLVTLLMPAALMVLIHTRSLIASLSPGQVFELVGSIGKPYLLLFLFLFCLSSAQMFLVFKCIEFGINPIVEKWMALQEMLTEIESGEDFAMFQAATAEFDALLRRQRPRVGMALFGINFAAMYFTTVAFNMMGYVLYQYHQALGLCVDEPRPARGGQRSEPEDAAGEQIAAFLAEGRMDKALDVAYEEQRIEPDSIAAQERYHKLLHLAGKTDRLLTHANRFIALLLRQQKADKALEALRRCREQAPDFRPEDPATLLALAQSARGLRDPKQALDIMRSFDKKHPRHPLIPDVYALSARILCEDLRQDAMADRIFATLIERYPEHPSAAQAREYRGVLAKMRKPEATGA